MQTYMKTNSRTINVLGLCVVRSGKVLQLSPPTTNNRSLQEQQNERQVSPCPTTQTCTYFVWSMTLTDARSSSCVRLRSKRSRKLSLTVASQLLPIHWPTVYLYIRMLVFTDIGQFSSRHHQLQQKRQQDQHGGCCCCCSIKCSKASMVQCSAMHE